MDESTGENWRGFERSTLVGCGRVWSVEATAAEEAAGREVNGGADAEKKAQGKKERLLRRVNSEGKSWELTDPMESPSK